VELRQENDVLVLVLVLVLETDTLHHPSEKKSHMTR